MFALAALGFGLLMGEILFRAVFPLPELSNFNRVDFSELLHGVPDQPPLANAAVRWTSDPDQASFVAKLNLYGFRDDVTWRLRPDPARRRVVFLGDSFVEGMMAADDETIPRGFARAATEPVEAMNLGMAGTGFAHYLRLASTALPLFRPLDVVLVVYANDLPPPAYDARWMTSSLEAVPFKRWVPRPLHVVLRALRGRLVPRRWHAPPFPFFGPVPDPTNPLSDRAAGYEPFVEPALLDAMRRGVLNPFLSDHLQRASEQLGQPFDARPHLEALASLARRSDANLHVVYVPHSLQVSDYYMSFTRRYAVMKPVASLTGPEYQRHAATLAKTCAALGLPFIDMTTLLRAEESAGRHMYWDYDNHMRAAGYSFVARTLAGWMR